VVSADTRQCRLVSVLRDSQFSITVDTDIICGSSAGRSSASSVLGIGRTCSRLLQLLDRRSVVNGMICLHVLSHNDPAVDATTGA